MKPTDVSFRDVGFRRGQGSESCQEKRQERGIFCWESTTISSKCLKYVFDNYVFLLCHAKVVQGHLFIYSLRASLNIARVWTCVIEQFT